MSGRERLCLECRCPESEHHEFDPPAEPPAGCVCDPHDWRNPLRIPAACHAYRDNSFGCCGCGHLAECHDATPPDDPPRGAP